jgi:hypothetical protein
VCKLHSDSAMHILQGYKYISLQNTNLGVIRKKLVWRRVWETYKKDGREEENSNLLLAVLRAQYSSFFDMLRSPLASWDSDGEEWEILRNRRGGRNGRKWGKTFSVLCDGIRPFIVREQQMAHNDSNKRQYFLLPSIYEAIWCCLCVQPYKRFLRVRDWFSEVTVLMIDSIIRFAVFSSHSVFNINELKIQYLILIFER